MVYEPIVKHIFLWNENVNQCVIYVNKASNWLSLDAYIFFSRNTYPWETHRALPLILRMAPRVNQISKKLEALQQMLI